MNQNDTFFGTVLSTLTRRPLILMLASLMLSQAALADKVIFLARDSEALQARVDLIQHAKEEIIAEYFYISNDDEAVGGIALLLSAAQRGVKVKVIADSLFSKIPTSIFSLLQEYGKDKDGNQTLEVKIYNPVGLNPMSITHRDHAKMLVIDGQRVISGGRNVGEEFFGLNKTRNFDDLDILAEGAVAGQARDNFMQVWESDLVASPQLREYSEDKLVESGCLIQSDQQHCEFLKAAAIKQRAMDKDRLARILKQIQTKQDDDRVISDSPREWLLNRKDSVDAEFMSHDPKFLNSPGHDQLSKRLIEILRSAQTDVNIISPYLIPPPTLMKVFQELMDRGVRVRIITNSLQSTDNLFAQAGYRTFRQKMIKMGLEIYEYTGPDTVHAKTAVIDNKIALIGTFNLDPRSSYINREVAIKMTDTDDGRLITELTENIDHFRQDAILVSKDGVEYNKDREFKGIGKGKKVILKLLNFVMPLIKNQL